MPQWILLVIMILVVIIPLFFVFHSNNWPNNTNKTIMVTMPLLMFIINAPIHEISHMMGVYIVGGKIVKYNLIQKFWIPNSELAMIVTSNINTNFEKFISSMFPYLLDITLLTIGLALLYKHRPKSAWTLGIILLFFTLRPSFDIIANVVTLLFFHIGDFKDISNSSSYAISYVIQLIFVAISVYSTIRAIMNCRFSTNSNNLQTSTQN
jgi:hypothetical protein